MDTETNQIRYTCEVTATEARLQKIEELTAKYNYSVHRMLWAFTFEKKVFYATREARADGNEEAKRQLKAANQYTVEMRREARANFYELSQAHQAHYCPLIKFQDA